MRYKMEREMAAAFAAKIGQIREALQCEVLRFFCGVFVLKSGQK